MGEKNLHEDQKYITGLLQNNPFVIQSIYDKFVPKVVNYIKQNNGSADEAKDVVQETIITIYSQARQKNLQLTCPFDAYFFLLCKRKWLNYLKKNYNKQVTINETTVSIGEDAQALALETELFGEKQALFSKMFKQLGQACKELLKATFTIKSMEKVAETLGITYTYGRKKKSLCIGKLTEMVRNSPKFNQLKL